MGLLSVNIAKEKRLFLKEVKLTGPEPLPSNPEEVAFNKALQNNPAVKVLVDRLGLVSAATNTEIKINDAQTEVQVDKLKLTALAVKLLATERTYTQEEVIGILQQQARASRERAEKGFVLMLQVEAIKPTIDPTLFYLADSTPF